MNADELHSSVRTLIAAEASLHNVAQGMRNAVHAGPRDLVPEADEAQALATLVYHLRHRVELRTPGEAVPPVLARRDRSIERTVATADIVGCIVLTLGAIVICGGLLIALYR